MPKNNDEEEVDLEEEEVFDEDDEDEEDDPEDGPDLASAREANKKLREKAVARRLKIQELKKQVKEKNKKPPKDEKKVEKKEEEEKKEGLDKTDRAVLRSEKITRQEEIALVESTMKKYGWDVFETLEDELFQTKLEKLREGLKTKDASISGSKRSGQSSSNDVDYWLAKGGIPKDNPELAQKVVNARMKKKRGENTFSDTPVVD